jgi:hypothetical protein
VIGTVIAIVMVGDVGEDDNIVKLCVSVSVRMKDLFFFVSVEWDRLVYLCNGFF